MHYNVILESLRYYCSFFLNFELKYVYMVFNYLIIVLVILVHQVKNEKCFAYRIVGIDVGIVGELFYYPIVFFMTMQ